MKAVNVYEDLYTNMKERFTVVNDSGEYSIGEYMLMKAGAKKNTSSLPVARAASSAEITVSAFFKYVNDKLAVKSAPQKDKTIRRFPFRTSLTAVLSALVVCTLILSYGAIAIRGTSNTTPATVEVNDVSENEIDDLYTTEN